MTQKDLQDRFSGSCTALVSVLAEDGKPAIYPAQLLQWNRQGIFFLTQGGPAAAGLLTDRKFAALSVLKGTSTVCFRGNVRPADTETTALMLKNTFSAEEQSRESDIFYLYHGSGVYRDKGSDPGGIQFDIEEMPASVSGFYAGKGCTGCGVCQLLCPVKCIDITQIPAVIDQEKCSHCGRCAAACPIRVIEKVNFPDNSEM